MSPPGTPPAERRIGEAFLEADFNWTMALQGIWRAPPTHVPELHGGLADQIMRDFRRLGRADWTQALGRVLCGPIGSGKTHLISALRGRAWEAGGWFVHIDIVGMTDFWRTVVLGFVESLRHPLGGAPQYEAVFRAALKTIDPAKAKALASQDPDLRSGATATVDLFVKLLKAAHPEGQRHADVVRALLLQRDPDTMDVAYAWLQGLDVPHEDRAGLGLASPPPPAVEVVQGISWLMSLGGPTMIAVDQVDSIISMGNIAEVGAGEVQAKARAVFEVFSGGLMDLRDQTRRSMTVLSCYVESWDIIATKALGAVQDRFMLPPLVLREDASTPAVVAALIERRLARAYDEAGIAPADSLWPFDAAFCEEAKGLVARQVLRRCDAYRHSCERSGEVVAWSERAGIGTGPDPSPGLEAIFDKLSAEAVPPSKETSYAGEGDVLAGLLRFALDLHARHAPLGDGDDVEVEVEGPSAKPVLHARLKYAPADKPDHQYCFRVLGHAHHRAFQPRLAAAITAAGVDKAMPRRGLAILRATPLPGGKVTEQLIASLRAGGGVIVATSERDLRTILALRAMLDARTPGLDAWLADRQPLRGTDLFAALGLDRPPWPSPAPRHAVREPPPRADPGAGRSPVVEGAALMAAESARTEEPRPIGGGATQGRAPTAIAPATSIPLGRKVQGGSQGGAAELPVALLTRHVAMFAGSGSGKTVLLRRIVEEAALVGIPSIVLDTNNDLARLGTAWPGAPEGWDEDDALKAARYHRDVDVVVWTPGVSAGRPLSLPVLPSFARLADDEERGQAVEMAWATLSPLVGASGASKVLKEGLLKQALAAFAAEGREGVEAFIDFLMDLPAEASKLRKAGELAAAMGDQLRAKIAVNPLLGGTGSTLDPATLFTSDRPGATRVSVINFAGLEADASRQDFVNQLQMALFAHIRRSPSETPRLYVCDEAQNFAPSGSATASKASAIALVRQGRKFGLGMVFATQAPKGIDTNIVSNCVTHFYGRMASPALMDAAEAMMASRGRAAKDLGALTRGTFYFSTEHMAQPVRIATPNCLSFHPQNPATPEEVAALAKAR